jgi:outer membrane biosynthesis protein TonB
MFNKSKFIPFLAVSALVHITALFIFLKVAFKPIYLSAPIEVAFYSPADKKTDIHSIETPKPQKEQTKEVKKEAPAKSEAKKEPVKTQSSKDDIKIKEKKTVSKEKANEKGKAPVASAQAKDETSKEEKPPAPKKETPAAPSQAQTVQAPPNAKQGATGAQYEGLRIDAADFDYAYYERTIVNKIGRNWEWLESYGSLRVVIYFRILKNGMVDETSVHVYETSRNQSFDDNAKNAVLRASPFGDLPEAYRGDSIGVYFEFRHKR